MTRTAVPSTSPRALPAVSLRDLELRHLIALRVVAEERSFGRAATQLGFTQSAISQQIAALERVVGTPMFERPGGPKPIQITPAGTLLLAHAEAILERVKAAEADLVGYLAGDSGHVTIGTFQSTSVRLLPPLLTDLARLRPDVEVRLVEYDEKKDLLALLRSGDLDLTFVIDPVTDPDLVSTPLGLDPFVVLCPPGSPIVPANGGPVPTARLAEVSLIGETPSSCQNLIEASLRRLGVEPRIVFRSGDNMAIAAMVRAGIGHAVMPLLAIDPDDPGLIVRNLVPALSPRGISLVRMKDRHLPPVVELIVELAVTLYKSETNAEAASKQSA